MVNYIDRQGFALQPNDLENIVLYYPAHVEGSVDLKKVYGISEDQVESIVNE
jgi:hypothetical protein